MEKSLIELLPRRIPAFLSYLGKHPSAKLFLHLNCHEAIEALKLQALLPTMDMEAISSALSELEVAVYDFAKIWQERLN